MLLEYTAVFNYAIYSLLSKLLPVEHNHLKNIPILDWPFFHVFQITNHEEVISQSLNTEDTKTRVVNFLSKVTKGPQS